ncbi:endonuclease I [Streptomyces spongiae]|uniref:Serine protease n=2 Tax=Streptomyces spongiae TaxID=565072 RepID=A0A5N8XUT8_9ACTN|nr:endonuclease I [Streptomyces spongiae]
MNRVPNVQSTTDGETAYLAQLKKASARYAQRTTERERNEKTLEERGVLYADEPERVEKRLARLGVDWSLATTIQQTPTEPAKTAGSTLPLPPESFGSDILGLERLIGRNDLMPAAFLVEGAQVARSVGRITISGPDGGFGTGFMVSPSLLLTNNHVLRSHEEAARSFVEFNLQAGADGRPLSAVSFRLEPQRFFTTDRELDYSLVAVAPDNAEGDTLSSYGWLVLNGAQGKAIIGEFVNIIQHPRGEPKQLALRENEIVDVLERFLHYQSDTQQGSSGSPVFNDQWEVVALHHSAVPKTGADGQPLSIDGTPWTPAMGESRLAWKANEGVRISRVLQALQETTLTAPEARLRDEMFTAGPAPVPMDGAPLERRSSDGAMRVTTPVEVTITVGATQAPRDRAQAGAGARAGAGAEAGALDGAQAGVLDGTPVAAPQPTLRPTLPPLDGAFAAERDVDAALVNFHVGQERPYYDRQADSAARDAYYRGISVEDGRGLLRNRGRTLGQNLMDLLERTHTTRPTYKPMRLVYPWVDLHQDGRLRSIYSGKTFTAEELIRADAAVAAARTTRIGELLQREGTTGPDQLEAEFDELEAALPFNCEHVVPQSWFRKKEPMRGDLHHLFACEPQCNSFRGNFPFFDFPGFEEAQRQDCGMREEVGFEPEEGKGAVARATLYFLLRYPGQIGDGENELPEERLATLLAWHESEPVSEYEQHRNAAIAEIQGNRNPLVDHPEWATRIDFAGTFV